MSVGMPINWEDNGSFRLLDQRIKALGNPDLRDLMANIGSEVTAQTKRRIKAGGPDPDGAEWKDWSREYAASRHGAAKNHAPHPGSLRKSGKHTMLILDGNLVDDIQFEVVGNNEAIVGSSLKYAGSVNADRQFLGLSAENEDDIEALVNDFFEDRLTGR